MAVLVATGAPSIPMAVGTQGLKLPSPHGEDADGTLVLDHEATFSALYNVKFQVCGDIGSTNQGVSGQIRDMHCRALVQFKLLVENDLTKRYCPGEPYDINPKVLAWSS